MEQLEKIDVIRDRIGVSYREASQALEEAEGDLVRALVIAEEMTLKGWGDRVLGKGEEMFGQVKSYIKKGNRTKIKLKKEDRTIAEFSATTGAVGLLAALASTQLAVIAGIGTVAAVANNVSLEIDKGEGETNVFCMERHKRERE